MKKLGLIIVLVTAVLAACGQAQLELPYSIKVLNPKPLDGYYFNTSSTPYTSTAQVTSQVSSAVRFKGQTFNVNGVEYWFQNGTADADLILKVPFDGTQSFLWSNANRSLQFGITPFTGTPKNGSLTIGYQNINNGDFGSIAAGESSEITANGGDALVLGEGTYVDEYGGKSIGRGTAIRSGGVYSFAGGGWSPGFTNGKTNLKVPQVTGSFSFGFYGSDGSQTDNHGVNANFSAIVGGFNSNIPSTSPRSVALGGNGIKIPASSPDVVGVPALYVYGTTFSSSSFLELGNNFIQSRGVSGINKSVKISANNDGSVYLTNNSNNSLLTIGLGDPANSTITDVAFVPDGLNSNINVNISSRGSGVMSVGGGTVSDSYMNVGTNQDFVGHSPAGKNTILSSSTDASLTIGSSVMQFDVAGSGNGGLRNSYSNVGMSFTRLTTTSPTLFSLNFANGISGSTSGQSVSIKSGDGFNSGNTAGGNINLNPGAGFGLGQGGSLNMTTQAGGSVNITSANSFGVTAAASTIGSSTNLNLIAGGSVISTSVDSTSITSDGNVVVRPGTGSGQYAALVNRTNNSFVLVDDISPSFQTSSGSTFIPYTLGSSVSGYVPLAISAFATLDFPNTTTGVSDLTISMTGAVVGDVCTVGVPNGSVTTTGSFWCWVSSIDVVTVRFSPKATGGENPNSGTFIVRILKAQ